MLKRLSWSSQGSTSSVIVPKEENNIIQTNTNIQEATIQINSLLLTEFRKHNIEIYGSWEEPLFKAKDVGDMLEIKNIRESIKEYDEDEKIDGVSIPDSMGRLQKTTCLTEQGLYKVLMTSRKKEAKQFQKFVFNLLKEHRLNLKKQLLDQQTINEQNRLLLEKQEEEIKSLRDKKYEEIEKLEHLYVIRTDGGTKVGRTNRTTQRRKKDHQTANKHDIETILDFETFDSKLLEDIVHKILDRYRCNSGREFFDCRIDYIVSIVKIIGNTFNTLKSTYENISEEEILEKINENYLDNIGESEALSVVEVVEEIKKGTKQHIDIENSQDKFYKSLKGIKYTEDNKKIMKFNDICIEILNKTLKFKEASKYITMIDKYIEENYEHKSKYKRHGKNHIGGWKNYEYTKIEDPSVAGVAPVIDEDI